jgi:Cytochrome c7 and related cytochrome c/Class III cytochrome C family
VALNGVLFTLPFCVALNARAQQPAATAEVKQEVPDNPTEHAPPEQPIPYSHKTHLALGLPCATCHTNPAPGNLMTFPATSTCMSCHISIATKKPAIEKLAAFSNSRQPIPWVRVYQVLPGVTWTHRKHLDAGMKCQMCHGQVGQMDKMSEATSVTTMAVCLSCHKEHAAPTACSTCHAWPPAN